MTIENTGLADEDYNGVDTYGARAALRIDLNENWTVTPTLMHQEQKADGAFAYDPSVGDLKVARYRPEKSDDRWTMAALTVEGKIGNLDLVYAGSYLTRDVDTESDYSDYSYFYQTAYPGYFYVYNDAGESDRSVAVHQGQGPLRSPGARAALLHAGRCAHALRRRTVLSAPGAWHRAALQGRRHDRGLGGHRLARHDLADRAEAESIAITRYSAN